jgi:hypothetical protein
MLAAGPDPGDCRHVGDVAIYRGGTRLLAAVRFPRPFFRISMAPLRKPTSSVITVAGSRSP